MAAQESRRRCRGAVGEHPSWQPPFLQASVCCCSAESLPRPLPVPQAFCPISVSKTRGVRRLGCGPLIRAALSAWVIGAAQIPRAAPPWSPWPRTSLACPHLQHPVPLCVSCGAQAGSSQLLEEAVKPERLAIYRKQCASMA